MRRRTTESTAGYGRAQLGVEPMDPNDRVRQKTQARDIDYPYDAPPMYGHELGVDQSSQAAYPTVSWTRPPVPKNKRPEDIGTRNAWDLAMEEFDSSPFPNHELDVMLDRAEEGIFDPNLWAQFRSKAVMAFGSEPEVSSGFTGRPEFRNYVDWNANNAWVGNKTGALRQMAQSQLTKMYNRDSVPGFTPDETFVAGLEIIRKIARAVAQNVSNKTAETYEPGSQAPDAARLGYGNHGRMGDGLDPASMELDALKQDFKTAFLGTMPVALSLPSRDLFALLADLDPEYTADLFAPEDDSEMQDTYSDWGQRVYAPGAEDDPE